MQTNSGEPDRGNQAASRKKSRKAKSRRELARALAPLVGESWHLDLAFNWDGTLPSGHGGVCPFTRYIEKLPELLDACPDLLALLAGLEAYDPARRNPAAVGAIARGEKAWPKLLKPWRTLRELLFYQGEPVPEPGWLRPPSHWAVAGSGPLLTESENKTRRARK